MLIMIWTWTDLDVKYEFTTYLPSLKSMTNRTVRAVPKINTSIHSPQVHQMFDTIIQPFQIQRQMGSELFRPCSIAERMSYEALEALAEQYNNISNTTCRICIMSTMHPTSNLEQ